MPNQTNNEKEMLRELEKLVKKVIRKSLKDNTLDYSVQFTISNLEPGHVKYATMISSPANGVQPVIFSFDKFEDLKAALIASETEINRRSVEIAFHKNRINTFENKVQSHKARLVQLEDPNFEDEVEEDDIKMEEV